MYTVPPYLPIFTTKSFPFSSQGPETLREVSFQQTFGRDLAEANEWCHKFIQSGKESDLNQAWDLYYHVFLCINKQLPQLTKLELNFCSPRLLEAKNLELAVHSKRERIVIIDQSNVLVLMNIFSPPVHNILYTDY